MEMTQRIIAETANDNPLSKDLGAYQYCPNTSTGEKLHGTARFQSFKMRPACETLTNTDPCFVKEIYRESDRGKA